MPKLLIVVFLGAVILVMLVAGALVVTGPSSNAVAEPRAMGQAVRMDDFTFTALSAERASNIGESKPQGVFYIVSLRVENHAKVVPFRFRPENAVLVDAAGQEYRSDAAARSAWFAANHTSDACAAQVPAGKDCTTTLVYAVPAETRAPLLKVDYGGNVGDFLNTLQFGTQEIQLK